MADWLNYHHLLYFFTVVREGGVAPSATRLRLSQSAVSAQLRTFQNNLGQTLLRREGRGVALFTVWRNRASSHGLKGSDRASGS